MGNNIPSGSPCITALDISLVGRVGRGRFIARGWHDLQLQLAPKKITSVWGKRTENKTIKHRHLNIFTRWHSLELCTVMFFYQLSHLSQNLSTVLHPRIYSVFIVKHFLFLPIIKTEAYD